MRITRIRADASGVTSFDELEIPLEDAGLIGRLSQPVAAESVVFRETGADYDYDWHPAPARQFVVLLDGEIEIEVGSGEIRRFAGGEVLLLEDTTGRGHRTRNVGPVPRRSLFVPLAPDARLG
jgi:quercetin dioxygenase-like cupin family protein